MKVTKKLKTGLKPKKLKDVNKAKKPLKKSSEAKVKTAKKSLVKTQVHEEVPAVKKSNKKVKENRAKNGQEQKKSAKKMPDLKGIKSIDPELYKFLKENDKKLLEFNFFDSDESEEEDDDEADDAKVKKTKTKSKNQNVEEEEEDSADDEKYHKPTLEDLEVASDESDFDDDDDDAGDEANGTQKITLNLLRQWQTQLEAPNVSVDVVRKVIQAFNAALASLESDGSEAGPTMNTPFKVVGSAAFNGVIQLSVLHLQPAIWHVLGVQPNNKQPLHKYKKWLKLRSCLRYYVHDLAQLLQQISSPNILGVLLKHLHQMAPVVCCFSTLCKTMLKRLITLWSTDDETVRVIAFLCILKITRNQSSMLHHVLKAMYLSYVRNSKFVSPNTLPSINFMRRSLVEMFALDTQVSYQHAFLYIRQLAIYLRNAVVLKKKDSFQAVYNWQFVNSLRLWADLLGATAYKPQLQPLIYPLITIIFGVVRLIPTAQYFPLRFHCVQQLVSLAKTTNVYIPLLPLLLEVLRSNTFNRKHTKVSMRPMPFICILRLNKTQLSENGFRDETVEQVCALTLEFLAHESASLAFSDLVVPTVLALKAYLKVCRNANYSRKLKQLLDKIQENATFINRERQKLSCGLQDLEKIQAWETEVRNKGTPLDIYYASWVKTHETKKRRQAAQAENINSDYGLPTIKKQVPKDSVAVRDENGKVELFPGSDSENDLPLEEEEDEVQEEAPAKKRAKKQKRQRVVEEDISADADVPVEENTAEEIDIVKDLDLDDW